MKHFSIFSFITLFMLAGPSLWGDEIGEFLNPCLTSDYYKTHKNECDAKAKKEAENEARSAAVSKAREKAIQEDIAKNGVPAKDICKKDGGTRFSRAALKDPLVQGKSSIRDTEGLPVLVASLRKSELKAIYSEVLSQYDPYQLALGGTLTENAACELRAHRIGCDLLNNCGIMTGKVFVESESGEFSVDLGENGSARWKAHVANVIFEEDDNGNSNLMVIDPLANIALKRKGPMPYKEWFDFISAKGQAKLKTTFSYPGQRLPGSRFAKDNSAKANCLAPSNDEMARIHNDGRRATSPFGGGTAR